MKMIVLFLKPEWMRKYIYIFFLFPLLFLSCALPHHINTDKHARFIKNVPFYPQKLYHCGPASLAGVLNYWKLPVTQDDVADAIYSKTAKGTLNIDMLAYVEKKGFKVKQFKSSISDIPTHINSGYPLIVMVDYGLWRYQKNHFMVIVGYNNNGAYVNSGEKNLMFINFNKLYNIWKKTNFWTMLITPW